MSRRRAPGAPGSPNRRRAPRTPSSIPGHKLLRVVCTDKGQHPEVSFGDVSVWPDGHGGWSVQRNPQLNMQEYVEIPADDQYPMPEPLPERLRRTYPLRCRRCRRNVPLKQETLERVCAELAAADTPKFDISDI